MPTADRVAGHPVAIRVGGRRMSQSGPIRSPTKTATQQSPGSSPQDGEGGLAATEVPDYPRPRSPGAKAAEAKADEPQPQAQQEQSGGNREERRRQERRREKQEKEQQQGHNNNGALSSNNDAMFNHLHKGAERNARQASSGGTTGVRITQPAGKLM